MRFIYGAFKLDGRVDILQYNMYISIWESTSLGQASRHACWLGGSNFFTSKGEVTSLIDFIGGRILYDENLCDEYDNFYLFEKQVIYGINNNIS